MEIQDRICAVSTLVLMLSVYKDAEILNEAETHRLGNVLKDSLNRHQREKHAALGLLPKAGG